LRKMRKSKVNAPTRDDYYLLQFFFFFSPKTILIYLIGLISPKRW